MSDYVIVATDDEGKEVALLESAETAKHYYRLNKTDHCILERGHSVTINTANGNEVTLTPYRR